MGLFGKSKRVRMGEAMRGTCRPLMHELGFRNPRRSDPERWGGSRLDVFLRWRGVDYDEVHIDWWRFNRPRFRIRLMTSAYERDEAGSPTQYRWVTKGAVYPRVVIRNGELKSAREFGPWSSPRRTAEIAVLRLREANHFFLTGELSPHITSHRTRLGPDLDPRSISPWWRRFGDPALDPESDVSPPDGVPR